MRTTSNGHVDYVARGLSLKAGSFLAPGAGASYRPYGDVLNDMPTYASNYEKLAYVDDYAPAINAALARYSNDRVNPPGGPGFGTGMVGLRRGVLPLKTPLNLVSVLGGGLFGHATASTTLTTSISTSSMVPLTTYDAVLLRDFVLGNLSATAGDSIGISLNPTGGGGRLDIQRLGIYSYHYGIYINGTTNGDKSLVQSCNYGGNDVFWSNGSNRQAIGWTFLNCSGAANRAHFQYTGSGQLTIIGNASNLTSPYIEIGEGAGNILSGYITVQDTKLEYSGGSNMMLVDASRAVIERDGGGSAIIVNMRNTVLASGAAPPDPTANVCLQIGNKVASNTDSTPTVVSGAPLSTFNAASGVVKGSDGIHMFFDGGYLEGIIRSCAHLANPYPSSIVFNNMIKAPDPNTVQRLGAGRHPKMIWRNCVGIPDTTLTD